MSESFMVIRNESSQDFSFNVKLGLGFYLRTPKKRLPVPLTSLTRDMVLPIGWNTPQLFF